MPLHCVWNTFLFLYMLQFRRSWEGTRQSYTHIRKPKGILWNTHSSQRQLHVMLLLMRCNSCNGDQPYGSRTFPHENQPLKRSSILDADFQVPLWPASTSIDWKLNIFCNMSKRWQNINSYIGHCWCNYGYDHNLPGDATQACHFLLKHPPCIIQIRLKQCQWPCLS